MTDHLPHTLRSDARDNRERILDAARTVFAADGLDVPMRQIALQSALANSDPLGEGWFFKVPISDMAEFDQLMDGPEYDKLLKNP